MRGLTQSELRLLRLVADDPNECAPLSDEDVESFDISDAPVLDALERAHRIRCGPCTCGQSREYITEFGRLALKLSSVMMQS